MTVNLQQVTSVSDLAAKLLREFFKIHPVERLRHLISHFRIIPVLTTNLKRLQKEGYVIYSNSFEIEDPFFKEWIIRSS